MKEDTLAATLVALLDARAEIALDIQTPGGSHALYRQEQTWDAVACGHATRVPTWLAQFIHAALSAPLEERKTG